MNLNIQNISSHSYQNSQIQLQHQELNDSEYFKDSEYTSNSPFEINQKKFLFNITDHINIDNTRQKQDQEIVEQEKDFTERKNVILRKSSVDIMFLSSQDDLKINTGQKQDINADQFNFKSQEKQENNDSSKNEKIQQIKQQIQSDYLQKKNSNSNNNGSNNNTELIVKNSANSDFFKGSNKSDKLQIYQDNNDSVYDSDVKSSKKGSVCTIKKPLTSRANQRKIQQSQKINESQIRINQKDQNINTQNTINLGNQFKGWHFTQFIMILVFVQKFIRKSTQSMIAIKLIFGLHQNVITALNDQSFIYKNYEQRYQFYQMQLDKKESQQNQQLAIEGQNTQSNTLLFQKKKKKINKQQKQNIFLPCFKRIGRFWNKIPSLQPNEKIKIFIDCWLSFWVCYRIFFTTVKFSFFITNIKSSIYLVPSEINMIITLSFILDMVMQFHTGYYEKGLIVLNKYKIAVKYIYGNLSMDLIVQIPLVLEHYVNENSSQQFITICFFIESLMFLKMYSLQSIFNRLERVVTENDKIAALFPLISLCLKIIVLSHIVGLFYHGVAVVQIQLLDESKTWLHTMELEESDWVDKYIHCLYWSVSTMVTILLYIPATNIETIFSVTAIFLMTGVFGYALNTIGMIIQDVGKKSKIYKAQRQMANRFFKKRGISDKLKERITLYLEFVHQEEMEKNEEEEQIILDKLSNQLKLETMKEINQHHIDKFKIQLKPFSQETRDNVLGIMSEENYSPDEFIIEGHNDNLYVICKGTAQIIIQGCSQERQKVFEMQKYDIFGQFSFFSGEFYKFDVKSLESCMVLKIPRKQFIEVLQQSPEDYQIFCMLKDQYSQTYTSELIPKTCELCRKKSHNLENCTDSHYIVDPKQMIYDYTQLNTQLRSSLHERVSERTFNAKEYLPDIMDAIEDIFLQENPDTELYNKACEARQFYLDDKIIPQVEMDEEEEDIYQKYDIQGKYQFQDSELKNKASIDKLNQINSDQQIGMRRQSRLNSADLIGPQQQRRTSRRLTARQSQLIQNDLLHTISQQKEKLQQLPTKNSKEHDSKIIQNNSSLNLIMEKDEYDKQHTSESVLSHKMRKKRISQFNQRVKQNSQISNNLESSLSSENSLDMASKQQIIGLQLGMQNSPAQQLKRISQRQSILHNQQFLQNNLGNQGQPQIYQRNGGGSLKFQQLQEFLKLQQNNKKQSGEVNSQEILLSGLIGFMAQQENQNQEDFKQRQSKLHPHVLEQQYNKKQNYEILWDLQHFDKPKNWQFYLPHNNLENIELVEKHQTTISSVHSINLNQFYNQKSKINIQSNKRSQNQADSIAISFENNINNNNSNRKVQSRAQFNRNSKINPTLQNALNNSRRSQQVTSQMRFTQQNGKKSMTQAPIQRKSIFQNTIINNNQKKQ